MDRPVNATEDGQPAASAVVVAGLARELDALRRAVDPMRDLPKRVDGLADLITQAAETAAGVGAIGSGTPPSWLTHPKNLGAAEALLGELEQWMGAVYLRYADAVTQLPECWLWHPDLVEELLWLMCTWRVAYQSEGVPPSLAGDWHDRYRPGVVRRIAAVAGRCSVENHESGNPAVAVPLRSAIGDIAEWWTTNREGRAPLPPGVR